MGGHPSQYFMAASPHHPVMYFMVTTTIERLLGLMSVSGQYVPFITGPESSKMAVKKAFGESRPKEGHYVGVYNRTMTVVGSRDLARSGMYLIRESMGQVQERKDDYGLMNMTHYDNRKKLAQKSHSCFSEIHDKFFSQSKL